MESLDRVARVCGKIGFLVSTPIVALLMYKALSTGIYLPYIGCFVLVVLGITLTSYYYAKKNLIFVKAENNEFHRQINLAAQSVSTLRSVLNP